MIVSSHNEKIKLFTQYDHSNLSGEFVPFWREDLFVGTEFYEDVHLAIKEHDRAWIPLDKKPLWNEEKGLPHSFMDYPMKPKLDAYAQGVDEVEQLSTYSGYLNSKHFLSFFDQKSTDPYISRFISREIDRQNRIEQALPKNLSEEIIDFHFNLLQFCDDLSLYICLNKPGTSKEDEIFMFKDGFRQRFKGIDQQMNAYWITKEKIVLDPFPFYETFTVEISYKEINSGDVEEIGLQKAYNQAEHKIRRVTIENK